MFYTNCIVVLVAMGIRGQPIDQQSLSVGRNNMTVAVNPYRNAVQIIVANGANCPCTIGSSTLRRRDDYQHTPGIGYHKLHTRALDWNSARKTCQDEGGHLAIINSVAEKEVLRKMFPDLSEITGTDFAGLAYIGIHDFYNEGEWVTISGDSLSSTGFNRWANGEPNNVAGNENCGALYAFGELVDLNCKNPYAYFCELPNDPSQH